LLYRNGHQAEALPLHEEAFTRPSAARHFARDHRLAEGMGSWPSYAALGRHVEALALLEGDTATKEGQSWEPTSRNSSIHVRPLPALMRLLDPIRQGSRKRRADMARGWLKQAISAGDKKSTLIKKGQ